MSPLSRFTEELSLGFVYEPHLNTKTRLTEKVTICPVCHSMHSLRHEGGAVHCEVCCWTTSEHDHVKAA